MTASAAWNAIFQSFNGGAGYQAGEKVFIKVNLTTSYSNGCADANYNWTITCLGGGTTGWTYIGQSPQLMIALLDQLVNVAGVAQSNITIGDSSGLWVNDTGKTGLAATGSAYIDGGDISIVTSKASVGRDATGSILLAEDSVLDASSGGYIAASGKAKIL